MRCWGLNPVLYPLDTLDKHCTELHLKHPKECLCQKPVVRIQIHKQMCNALNTGLFNTDALTHKEKIKYLEILYSLLFGSHPKSIVHEAKV